MKAWLFSLATMFSAVLSAEAAELPRLLDFKAEPHNYFQRASRDPFALVLERISRGEVKLETGDDKAFLRSLLAALQVPVSSQMLLFSATSLQDDKIHPTNPRALYFNEDVYIGRVPGGRVEVIGIDPDIGAVFYIFDKLLPGTLPAAQRSDKCMNCHAGNATQRVPGLVAESVMPGANGASLESYRHEETGHQIPLENRFGGWYLTGGYHPVGSHANLMGQLSPRGMATRTILPGELYDPAIHLLPTSDILPQLIHEHQLGFVNQVVHLQYAVRSFLYDTKGKPGPKESVMLDQMIHDLTRYILFADEAVLPKEGIQGDPAFVEDFQTGRRVTASGQSLKDFDLKAHLFRYRCSYMLYTPLWQGLPAFVKERIYARLWAALDEAAPSPEFAYLGQAEKQGIRHILKETLRDLPMFWKGE